MNLRLRLLTGLLGGLLVAGAIPSAGHAASPSPSDRKAAAKPNYLYRATYEAQVVHELTNDQRPGASEKRRIATTLTGSLPLVEVSGAGDNDIEGFKSRNAATARASDSGASTVDVADAYTQSCSGNMAKVSGSPRLFPSLVGASLQLFTSLEFPMQCTDNQGSGPTESRLFLGAVPVYLVNGKGRAGDRTFTQEFSGDVKMPAGTGPSDDSLCPGYAAGATSSCQYTISGTLKLTLVKKLDPPKDQPQSQGGATVTPGKVKLKTQCPATCTIEIRVTPLQGGPTITVDRISPRPGRPTNVTLPIPPKKRKVVKKSGGVRISLTYKLAGGVRYSENRTARL